MSEPDQFSTMVTPLPMCSICHAEPPVNAIQLNCGHIFCYLCIRSAAETSRACALCRSEIGIEFNFQDHSILGTIRLPSSNNGFYWFYEGYRGWWLYDPDTNRDLEAAYNSGRPSLERFIAGFSYEINLLEMTQQRREGEGKVRKIRRDRLDQLNVLGMAGIRGPEFQELFEMMKEAELH